MSLRRLDLGDSFGLELVKKYEPSEPLPERPVQGAEQLVSRTEVRKFNPNHGDNGEFSSSKQAGHHKQQVKFHSKAAARLKDSNPEAARLHGKAARYHQAASEQNNPDVSDQAEYMSKSAYEAEHGQAIGGYSKTFDGKTHASGPGVLNSRRNRSQKLDFNPALGSLVTRQILSKQQLFNQAPEDQDPPKKKRRLVAFQSVPMDATAINAALEAGK